LLQYHSIEKSLMESQEKLTQQDQQIRLKDYNLDYAQQQIADFMQTLVGLQEQLKHEESEKMEQKHQLKNKKKEVENLKQIIATQNEAVTNLSAAKEESDKLTAELQLQMECLASEKINVEQQAAVLTDTNISLQKDLSVIMDSYEKEKKLTAELQLHISQLRQQNLTDQLEQNKHVEPAVKQVIIRSSASEDLSVNDKSTICDSTNMTWSKQCSLNPAMGPGRSVAFFDSQEGAAVSVNCATDCSADKELLNAEKIECGNDTVGKVTRGSEIEVVDTASKHVDLCTQRGGRRRVIKRFTRLSQSSDAWKHNSKPVSQCNSNLPNLRSHTTCSRDVNAVGVAHTVEQLHHGKSSQSNIASASNVPVHETISAPNLQENTSSVSASVPAVNRTSIETCSAEVFSVPETTSSKHLPVGEPLSYLQAASEYGLVSCDCNENQNSNMNTESDSPSAVNVADDAVDNDSHSHNQCSLALESSKRLNTDVSNDNEAKKLRPG